MNTIPIKNPHLPSDNVKDVIFGKLSCTQENELTNMGIDLHQIAALPQIESSLQYHADLAVNPIPGNRIIILPSQSFLKVKLISMGFSVIINKKEAASPYPTDCMLNFVDTKNYFIGNANICSCVKSESQIRIHCKQGYSKCSVVPVTENAIITDDDAIATKASEQGIDVCIVRKGCIKLENYPYGFIGGSCGKLSKDILAFCGNINTHCDHTAIKSFLRNYNVYAISLSNEELTDVGSIIPLTQRKE